MRMIEYQWCFAGHGFCIAFTKCHGVLNFCLADAVLQQVPSVKILQDVVETKVHKCD